MKRKEDLVRILIAIPIIAAIIMLPIGVLAHIGIPRDRDILQIFIKTTESARADVFGSSFITINDEFGNPIVVINDVYEARPYHWANTAKQKAFYGSLVEVKHFNLKYFKESSR